MTDEISRYGPIGLLIRPHHLTPAAVAEWFRLAYPDQVCEVVPGATTVLIEWHSSAACDQALRELSELTITARSIAENSDPPLVCPVVFDGPDLAEVAELINSSEADVIKLITSATFQVAFCGFAPGFGYLTGLPEVLHIPRRSTPRTRVEAGSMAIAAGYAAIYPSASPGGWNLLGTCDLPLWDLHADPPALMTPGRQVRFSVADDDRPSRPR
jgi:KipI family sensor histidine kinase inhibitor